VNEENSEQGIIYYSSLPGNATDIKNAIFIYSAGKFAQQWNNTATYGKSKVNSVNHKAIGNFNAATLLLDAMKNRAGGASQPYDLYGAPAGTFNATTNRGTYNINSVVVQEKNEWYSHIPVSAGTHGTASESAIPGVRYVYNVGDTLLPGYSTAKMTVGFDNRTTGAKSALCHGDDSAAITASGFVPLNSGATQPAKTGGGATTGHFGSFKYGTKATGTNTSDKAGAYCREFPGKHFPTQGGTKQWTPSTYVQAT
jgi:hypothetical protein